MVVSCSLNLFFRYISKAFSLKTFFFEDVGRLSDSSMLYLVLIFPSFETRQHLPGATGTVFIQ